MALGAEGKAYPLLAADGAVAGYLKFFTRPTQQRLNRTAWLIGQQMHTWLPGLTAAPLLWVDTRLSPRSAEIDFDFAGYLAQAVPGETWLELKNRIVEGGASLPPEFRWRCVEDLVLATAVLERAAIVHGDLSPNNIIIDLAVPAGEPALYLIDFDAFVAPAAGADQAVDVSAGGTYGTEGYCPPDLSARAAAGDGSAAPYSDRYGRDTLILELLLMDAGFSPDDPPATWNRQRLGQSLAEWLSACGAARRAALAHLETPKIFSLAEAARPSARQLAAGLGLQLPAAPAVCGDLPVAGSPAAIPGIRSVAAQVRQRRRRRRPGRAPAGARPPGAAFTDSAAGPLAGIRTGGAAEIPPDAAADCPQGRPGRRDRGGRPPGAHLVGAVPRPLVQLSPGAGGRALNGQDARSTIGTAAPGRVTGTVNPASRRRGLKRRKPRLDTNKEPAADSIPVVARGGRPGRAFLASPGSPCREGTGEGAP